MPRCGSELSGKGGAAALLDMVTTMLASKMKALGFAMTAAETPKGTVWSHDLLLGSLARSIST